MQNRFRAVGAFLIGLTVLILTGEVTLRLFAAPHTSLPLAGPSSKLNASIRIVAIGESTTLQSIDPETGLDTSWPGELERKLNSFFREKHSETRVVVFNLGRAASSSPFLIDEFEQRLDELKPDLVISMMGINDNIALIADRNWVYRNSYFVRLIFWATVAWQCPSCSQISYEQNLSSGLPVSPLEISISQRGLELFAKSQLTTLKALHDFQTQVTQLRALAGPEQHRLNFLLAAELFKLSQSPKYKGSDPHQDSPLAKGLLLESFNSLELSYDRMLKEDWALQIYCHISARLGRHCLPAVKEALLRGAHPSPQILTLALQGGGLKDEFLHRLLRAHGYTVSQSKQTYEATKISYQRLGHLSLKNGFTWVAAQYPTGKVAGLKTLLSSNPPRSYKDFDDAFYESSVDVPVQPEFKDVLFASNENFTDIVNSQNESEYFTDFFGRFHGLNFGHTTKKGHSLIAENLAATILAHWSTIETRALLRRQH